MMNIDNLPQYFGAFLRSTRKGHGLSQEELALRTGLDRTFISLLERGKRQPTLKTIFVLAQAFQMPVVEIIEQIQALDK